MITDAQVEAAYAAIGYSSHGVLGRSDMRAALAADLAIDEPTFSITRAPIYSLWEHKRTRQSVLVDKNRVTADGVRQVRIKSEGRAKWIDLEHLIENYVALPED